MIAWLVRNLYYPVVLLFLAVLLVRRAHRKRIALLAWACLFLGLWAVSHLFARLTAADWTFVAVIAVAAGVVILNRRLFLPWRLNCEQCGRRVGLSRLLASDDGLCVECREAPPSAEAGASKGTEDGGDSG
jgi:hypothetical protein